MLLQVFKKSGVFTKAVEDWEDLATSPVMNETALEDTLEG